jgi:hypothetical protein
MQKIIAVLSFLVLAGCNATVATFVPSFWDDNQSRSIITARQLIVNINCDDTQNFQAVQIQKELQWFELYSESKGYLQHDVLELIAPMEKTVTEWADRSREKEPSAAYCRIKKDILVKQAELASKAVLGRF